MFLTVRCEAAGGGGGGHSTFKVTGKARAANWNYGSFSVRFFSEKKEVIQWEDQKKKKKKGVKRWELDYFPGKIQMWTHFGQIFWKNLKIFTRCCQKRVHLVKRLSKIDRELLKMGSLGESESKKEGYGWERVKKGVNLATHLHHQFLASASPHVKVQVVQILIEMNTSFADYLEGNSNLPLQFI